MFQPFIEAMAGTDGLIIRTLTYPAQELLGYAALLYLRAREDRLVPASALAWVQQLRPDTRVAAFDAPHALLQACPVAAAKAVTAFVHEVNA